MGLTVGERRGGPSYFGYVAFQRVALDGVVSSESGGGLLPLRLEGVVVAKRRRTSETSGDAWAGVCAVGRPGAVAGGALGTVGLDGVWLGGAFC